MSQPSVEISNGIATITLHRPRSLNALTYDDYNTIAEALREIDQRDDVLVTVWQATGKWFCAGTDVKARSDVSELPTVRGAFVDGITKTNTDLTHALYTHRKILVAALNGPVMGIAAAFLGQFDFIYTLPNAWLAVPFTFIGIIAEAGSSVSFARRMGLAKANEVLIWGKKKEAKELLECGFYNKVFPDQSVDSFHAAVREQILNDLNNLDPTALLKVKELIKAGLTEQNVPEATNMRESYAQAERFASGTPIKKFVQLARKEIKHKL